MRFVQLFIVICFLWIDVQGELPCIEVFTAVKNPLQIVSNPWVEGVMPVETGWYREVKWKQSVEGKLQLYINRITPRKEVAINGTVDLCDLRQRAEYGTWCSIIRQALGIRGGCPVQKGKIAVSGDFFSAQPCKKILLNYVGRQDKPSHTNSVVQLDLSLHGTKILTGQLVLGWWA